MLARIREVDWTAIVETYQDRLTGLALVVVGDRQDAADVVQTVFEKAYRARNRVDPSRPIEGWLVRITCNEALNVVRRKQLVRWWPLSGREALPSHADGAEDRVLVEHALTKLDAAHRAVVGLFYLYGYGIDEVAAMLHIPRGTVASRLHYARSTLQSLVQDAPQGEAHDRQTLKH